MDNLMDVLNWAMAFAVALFVRDAISYSIDYVIPQERFKSKLASKWTLAIGSIGILWFYWQILKLLQT